MNKKIQKFLKVLVIGCTIVALSVPVFATPLLQKIEAFLNPNLTYVLDGEEVLEDAKAITYNDTTYISIRELSDALGKEISYNNGVITIRSEAQNTKGIETPELSDSVMIDKALIKEVDLENGKITILPDGKEDIIDNYIILNVDTETLFVRHEFLKIALSVQDLVPGYEVSIKHSPIMQPSNPPQTFATEIVILGGQEFPLISMEELTPAQKIEVIETATIKEINVESSQVIVLPAGKEDVVYNYITLNVDPKCTSIHHEHNKMIYHIDMLEVGMKITAKHSPIMTMSMPPQTPAIEIIVLADQN